jgi:hypothetical protein
VQEITQFWLLCLKCHIALIGDSKQTRFPLRSLAVPGTLDTIALSNLPRRSIDDERCLIELRQAQLSDIGAKPCRDAAEAIFWLLKIGSDNIDFRWVPLRKIAGAGDWWLRSRTGDA